MSNGWIGVDLDGTLAKYDGWKGVHHIGEPVPAMVKRVHGWLAEGREVRVFTARVSVLVQGNAAQEEEAAYAREIIKLWCFRRFGRVLPVTCTKDYAMVELWDDRAIQVEPNTGRRVDGAEAEDDHVE